MKFKPHTCKAQLAIAAALTLAVPSFAQQYPSKPVRLIVPFAPGGTTDILARTLGQALGDNLGGQVISDNRAGASGNLGTEIAAKAPPAGYTLLRDKLLAESAAPESSTPEELRLFIREEIAKWAKAVKRAGAKID